MTDPGEISSSVWSDPDDAPNPGTPKPGSPEWMQQAGEDFAAYAGSNDAIAETGQQALDLISELQQAEIERQQRLADIVVAIADALPQALIALVHAVSTVRR